MPFLSIIWERKFVNTVNRISGMYLDITKTRKLGTATVVSILPVSAGFLAVTDPNRPFKAFGFFEFADLRRQIVHFLRCNMLADPM